MLVGLVAQVVAWMTGFGTLLLKHGRIHLSESDNSGIRLRALGGSQYKHI